jgi:hypothetical protein
VLEAVFILLEFRSPSRRIFIGSHSLPPSLVRRIGPSAAPEDFATEGYKVVWLEFKDIYEVYHQDALNTNLIVAWCL